MCYRAVYPLSNRDKAWIVRQNISAQDNLVMGLELLKIMRFRSVRV
jgi:hypothetical protein